MEPRSGCRWGSLCGVTLAAACTHTPFDTGELRRRDVVLQPFRGHAAPVSPLRCSIPLLLSKTLKIPLAEVSLSDRVGTTSPRRPQYLCHAAAGPRSVATNLLVTWPCSALLHWQSSPPPRLNLSEYLGRLDRAVSKDTCGG